MKINYRPEIDGLRAIAVISVVLYHAQFTLFSKKILPGGFIGVDIFFVISGYLITSIILKELVITKNFSFKNFYLRRIRRIIPPIFVVIIFTFPFFFFLLLPGSLIDLSKSLFFTLIFGSNFYFYYSGLVYGAESGLLKPFLHTWSLSVEEQFYILFPFILFIIFKYLKKFLIHFFCFGFVCSLLLAQWGSENYPSFSFYILPTRGWELLAGSILAYLNLFNSNKRFKDYGTIFESLGLGLIIYALIFFDDATRHPSIITFLPVLGVSLILWFSKKDQIISNILSSKIMVSIGLISYSLYLWHYPIFAYLRYTNTDLGNIEKLEIIILSFILSIFTYFFIEKPARNKFIFSNTKMVFSISIVFFLLINLFFIVSSNEKVNTYWHEFASNKLQRDIFMETTTKKPLKQGPKLALYQKAYALFKDSERDLSRTMVTDNDCKVWYKDEVDIQKKIKTCRDKYKKAIFILGDSHGMNLYNILALNESIKFIVGYVDGGCRIAYCVSEKKGHINHYDLFIKQSEKFLERQDIIIYHQNREIGHSSLGLSFDETLDIAKNYFEKSILKKNKIFWLGPFEEWGYAPRIVINEFKKDQKSIMKYNKLNPDLKIQLQKLDKKLKNYFESSQVMYFSFNDLYEIPNKVIIDDENSIKCLLFYNEDHFSECGESIASKNLKRELLEKFIY